jgi:23S rRNA G2445 N2-methylase RlmL
MKYRLEVLKGTEMFVRRELEEKFPNVFFSTKFEFESDLKISEFKNLLSPTKIIAENKESLNLSKRYWRKSFVSAGINPSLGYVLCQIAGLTKDTILFDPFCGSSVIPITALLYFDVKKVIASDISGRAVFSSSANFESAGISQSRYRLFQSSVKDLKLNKRNVDRIITNLPFGIRVGEHGNNVKIYIEFEELCKKLLRRKGKIIVLTQEKNLLREVFKGWNIKSITRVNEGGLLPEVFEITFKQ